MLAVIEKLDEAVNFHDIKSRGQLGDIYEQILNDLRRPAMPASSTRRAPSRVHGEDGQSHASRNARPCSTPPAAPAASSPATIDALRKPDRQEIRRGRPQGDSGCIRGIEKKQLPHLLCITNMLLHGIDVPSMIEHRNTLARRLERLEAQRARRLHHHQSTLRRHGGRRRRATIPVRVPHSRNRRHVPRPHLKKLLKPKADVRRGATRWHALRRRREGQDQGSSCSASAICTPSSACPTASSIPTPASAPTCSSSPRASPPRPVWYYEHRYPAGVKSYNKTKPIRIEEFEPIANGGARSPMALRPASRARSRGKLISKSCGRKRRLRRSRTGKRLKNCTTRPPIFRRRFESGALRQRASTWLASASAENAISSSWRKNWSRY